MDGKARSVRRGLVDLLEDARAQLFEGGRVGSAGRDQPCSQALERVLLQPAFDLAVRTVAPAPQNEVLGFEMAVETVGVGLDERRSPICPRLPDGLACCAPDLHDVVAVDLVGGHVERARPISR